MGAVQKMVWSLSILFYGLGTASALGKIENALALFGGLDKITGQIVEFEVPVAQTVRFGTLEITPSVCTTRPVPQTPQPTAFVQISDLELSGERTRLFSGWLFADSPALNAVDHPIFDIWLTGCRQPFLAPPEEKTSPPSEG